MRRVARVGGLLDVQSVVLMGLLTMSAVRASDGQPLTQVRLSGRRNSNFDRLVAVSALVDQLESGGRTIDGAPDELVRIESMTLPYRPLVLNVATALSSASATLLFGGHAADALTTFLIALIVAPIVRRIERSGLPDFFQALLGPLLATAAVVLLVGLNLPIDGGLVMTGAILRFLPGGAIVAGMRDLIDRSIISGTARLAEAILLGSAVAVGAGLAVRAATSLGEAQLVIGLVRNSGYGTWLQAVAAGLSCAFFAVGLGVGRRVLISVFVLGGVAWAINLLAPTAGGDIAPVVVAAIGVGAIGQWLGSRYRLPAVLWTVPAILPLLPGLTIVRGILAFQTTEGVLTVIAAIGIGFALGAGVAFGAILVSVARHAQEVAQGVVLPGLVDVGTAGVRQLRSVTGGHVQESGFTAPEEDASEPR